MNRKSRLELLSIFAAIGCVTVVADQSLATVAGERSLEECCFSSPSTCADQGTATHCIPGCSSNQVCSGESGCEPSPWAEAKCIPKGGTSTGGGEDDVSPGDDPPVVLD